MFQSMLSRMDKCNLFLGTNVLLFDVLTILVHHFVLFCSILSQKKRSFMSKRKPIVSQAPRFLFVFYVGWTFKRLNIYQSGITMNISNT